MFNNYYSTVYLAGPISDIDIQEAARWRDRAQGALQSAGIRALNPLRGKDLSDPDLKVNLDYREVVERDLEDIRRSDVLLVDGRWRCCIVGTAMEIREAYTRCIEVVVFGRALQDMYWMRYHTDRFVDTLDDAIWYIVNEEYKAEEVFKNEICSD